MEFIDYIAVHLFEKSYTRLLLAACIIVATVFVKILFNKFFNYYINKSAQEVNGNPTNYKFLKHAITALIYIVGLCAAIYSIPSLRTLASSLLAGAGILAVAIGFAAQQAFSNIISGVFIIIFKPFRVNDRIEIKESITGIVEDITLRHTVIRNFDNKRVIIPNSVISEETLINSDFSEGKICKRIDLSVGYGTDIEFARKLIQAEAIKRPEFLDNRTDEQKQNNEHPVAVRVTAWGEYFVNLRVWVWAPDSASGFQLNCDLLEILYNKFNEEGIEIPFPYRNLIQK